MGMYTTEFVFFLLGLAGNFVMAALYDRFKAGRSARAASVRLEEERWRERLSSPDVNIRISAFHELSFHVLRWFVLGNVMFGISGIAWVLEFADLDSASNFVASATSLVAVLLFGRSLAWIKLYFRHSETVVGPRLALW